MLILNSSAVPKQILSINFTFFITIVGKWRYALNMQSELLILFISSEGPKNFELPGIPQESQRTSHRDFLGLIQGLGSSHETGF